MIRLMRIFGFLMIAAGAVVIMVWLIKPLRFVWPWLLELPWPIRFGLSVAAIGFLVLMASIIWERLEERGQDRALLDD